MKQLLGQADGVRIARMPAPALGRREVLVCTHYSLISTGTETASMPQGHRDDATESARRCDRPPLPEWSAWQVAQDAALVTDGRYPTIRTGPGHQTEAFVSPILQLSPNARHAFTARVRLVEGNIAFGILSADGSTWFARQSYHYPLPELCFRLDFTTPRDQATPVRLVFSNHRPRGEGPSSFALLELNWMYWPQPEVGAAAEDGDPSRPMDGPYPLKTRIKKSMARVLAHVTGRPAAKHEADLQALWRQFRGRRAPEVTLVEKSAPAVSEPVAEAVPESEWQTQGWTLGYSSAGEVIAVGADVHEFTPGDLVACAGAGQANHAELAAVPVNLVARLPAGVTCRVGCSATVGAIALQGVRRANLQLGERVAVLGLGLIGQLTVQLAKAAGCKVLGFDPQPDRVRRARRRGLDDGQATEDEMAAIVRRWTAEQGVDAVLITAAAKSDGPINLAMDLCRRRGRVVLSGDVDIHPRRQAFYQKEIDLVMATSYGPGRYDPTYEEQGRDYPYAFARWTANRNMQSYLEFLAAGSVEFLDLVDAEFPLNEAAHAYRSLRQQRKPLAVVLRYPSADESQEPPAMAAAARMAFPEARPLRSGPANFVLVGAGAFAEGMLLPCLLARPEFFQFYGVVSRRTEGVNLARRHQVPHVATEFERFLDDPAVHLLVIATRHHQHAAQAPAGLRAGKHVFVEKPLAISWGELESFRDGYEKLTHRPSLLVGFNRRFSPALRHLNERLAGRRGPLMMTYRVNAGRLPADHWVQGSQGGGRNVGEACHMYDAFRYLAGAPAAEVQAMPTSPRPADLLVSDNFTATVRYEDGSIGNLVYTALGPREGLPKERLEVFCDGTAFVLDDYCRLLRPGDTEPLWEGPQDKGHAQQLALLGESIVYGRPLTVPPEDAFEATALSLHVEDELRGAGRCR